MLLTIIPGKMIIPDWYFNSLFLASSWFCRMVLVVLSSLMTYTFSKVASTSFSILSALIPTRPMVDLEHSPREYLSSHYSSSFSMYFHQVLAL